MQRVRAGEIAAFETLYDRHSRAVYGLALRIVRDGATAEEVTQDAFLAVWRGRQSYASARGAVLSWILGIAHNRAIDATRRRRARPAAQLEADHDQLEAPERTDSEVIRRDEAEGISEALRSLPPAQRRVLDLAYFAGLSQSEIASKLGIPLGTVKGRMRLALEKLAKQLAPIPARLDRA